MGYLHVKAAGIIHMVVIIIDIFLMLGDTIDIKGAIRRASDYTILI